MQFLEKDRRVLQNSMVLMFVAIFFGISTILYAGSYSFRPSYSMIMSANMLTRLLVTTAISVTCAIISFKLKKKYNYQKALYINSLHQLVLMGQMMPQVAMQSLYMESQKSYERGCKKQKTGAIIIAISVGAFLLTCIGIIFAGGKIGSGWDALGYVIVGILIFFAVLMISINGFFVGLCIMIYGLISKRETFEMPRQ